MELLQFEITNAGTLGGRWTPPAPETKKASSLPGAALAALLQEEDDEDDWGGDAPDMSAEFARLGHLNEESDTDALPLTADFAPLPDGSLALVRWPRLARPAVVPDTVEGRTVTAIAATAFAASHLDESCFAQFGQSPISFSIFCMRMGRAVTTETLDEGGPTSVTLPDSITHIGPYAFYHCINLTSITLPDTISALPAGVFGDCSRLTSVHLPEQLQALGYLPRPTDQVMPDVGTFAGCHALKQLTLPPQLKMLGAHSFNSSGLATLTARDAGCEGWSRTVTVAASAFDHTAALLWLEKTDVSGHVVARLGLPVARDKILAGDAKFGAILRVPVLFFTQPIPYFDQLAQDAFRLDFSARMALARLEASAGLSLADRQWYCAVLVQYFDRAPQFMPCPAEQAYAALFRFLCRCELLTAADVSAILRMAGALCLPAELISEMMEVRTRRFETVTGFEDLELD